MNTNNLAYVQGICDYFHGWSKAPTWADPLEVVQWEAGVKRAESVDLSPRIQRDRKRSPKA